MSDTLLNQQSSGYNNQNNDYLSQSNSRIKFDKFTIIKLATVVVMITLIGVLSMKGMGFPSSLGSNACIIDQGFIITDAVNRLFQDNLTFRNFYLISSALLIDIAFLMVAFYWALFNKKWRLFWTLLGFYGIRGLTQNLYQMSFPEGYTWEYPGFPSVVVSYLKTNDFFYSGHVGMPTICLLEFRAEKKTPMMYFCLFVILYEGTLVLISRVHYTIDIIIGLIFAHYSFIMIDSICSIVTSWRNGQSSQSNSNTIISDKEKSQRQHEIKNDIDLMIPMNHPPSNAV